MAATTYPGWTDEAFPEPFNTVPPPPAQSKPGQLSEAQIKQFFQDGYVVIDKFFSPEELQPCRDAVVRLVDGFAKQLHRSGKIQSVWCPSENERKLESLVLRYREQISQKDKEIEQAVDQLHAEQKKVQEMILHLEVRGWNNKVFDKSLPVIYAITPTYSRMEQKAELTRLAQTFLHLPNFHWIIVEDSDVKTNLVTRFLSSCGISFTHLNILTPKEVKLKPDDPNWLKPRGVLQRHLALSWIRKNQNPSKQPGVVYFADDDNTYDLQIFAEMRRTEKVSVWPVGLVGALRYETPLVKNGKVTGWFTFWKPDRPFAMDMAGFAVNLQLLFDFPEAGFSNNVKRGYQESTLLTGLGITLDDLEPLADNCSKILVWHTRTEKTKLKNEDKLKQKYGHGSNLDIEV